LLQAEQGYFKSAKFMKQKILLSGIGIFILLVVFGQDTITKANLDIAAKVAGLQS